MMAEMTHRPTSTAPILAALAILLLPLGAYVAGYVSLGVRIDGQYIDLAGRTVDLRQRSTTTIGKSNYSPRRHGWNRA
jgi:hypothetical protein